MKKHKYAKPVSLSSLGLLAASMLLIGACEGSAGEAGTPCSVKANTDGTSTITCPDGTSVTVTGGKGDKGDPGTPGDAGAKGDPGDAGTSCTIVDNPDGTKTITCTDGTKVTISTSTVDYALLSPAEKEVLDPTLTIVKADFPADGKPVLTMKVTDRKGMPVKGLNSLTDGAGISWRAAVLKLEPGCTTAGACAGKSASDTWISYIAANATASAGTESASTTAAATATAGALKDNGDGTYTYTFAKVINVEASAGTKYEADKTHRIAVIASRSGNPFRPMNAFKDLVPATGADVSGKNEKVAQANCLNCHSEFRGRALKSTDFHGGARYDTHICVACHNDQRKFSSTGAVTAEPTMTASATTPPTFKWTGNAAVINGESVINWPVFVHKIHMGEELGLKPDRAGGGGGYSAVQFDEVTYPQDVRNCAKCHSGADKADNWKNVPSRRACGACHDNVSFEATAPVGRKAHTGGSKTDDTTCTLCHTAADITAKHQPVAKPPTVTTGTLPTSPDGQYVMSGWQFIGGASKSCTVASPCTCTTLNPCLPSANSNAAYIAAAGVVPTGAAKITYDVKEVLVDATTKNPKIVFKLIKDGTDVDFGTYAAGTKTELMDGFVGSPSAYFAWSLPQDGIAAPVDYNASASVYIKGVWDGTVTTSTLTRDTATGYYTLTVGSVVLPTTAKMVTGGLGYTYSMTSTQPLTQTSVAAYSYSATTKIGGLIVPAANVFKTATGYTARRAIVDNAKCNKCHGGLGVSPTFHAGQRNDGPTCSFCHNPNRVNGGWAVNSKDIIHAIHGSGKRTVPFTWHGEIKAWEVAYPGVLNNCQQCHTPNTNDFSASATASAVPNMLYSYAATGTYSSTPTAPATIGPFIAPYVTPGTNYGSGYTTSGTRTVGSQGSGASLVACTTAAPCTCTLAAPCNAEDTTLVHSPITAACSACHDSPVAKKHFADNNGSLYQPRATALGKPEQCLMCHGPGKVAAIADVHQ
ncbi:MAG: OmcA/MtrC family decaheme c-type cytochrome [Myxococcales bacterium]|nr:OmcA/MtrC family decaheme c-type cytochrome [Myxococcales bacterium]